MREAERARQAYAREVLRLGKAASRAAQEAYTSSREHEAEELNQGIQKQIHDLQSILQGASHAKPVDFLALRKPYIARTYSPSQAPKEPLRSDFKTEVTPPTWLAGLLGGRSKYEIEVQAAHENDEQAFQASFERWRQAFAEWRRVDAAAHATFQREESARLAENTRHNSGVDDFEKAYNEGLPAAAAEYFALVLDRLNFPDGFPEEFRLSFVEESKELVIEYCLPAIEVVPAVQEVSYIKSKDELREKPRKKADVRDLYQAVIASASLSVTDAVFSSDVAAIAQCIVFNGIVRTVSPESGEDISPCIVSVRVTRDEFLKINLRKVDPVACLRSLGAVSKKPEELAPIRPIIEFDMVDKRFVAELDAISTLESRPNIMELTPFEFESLVGNLFSKMGLETRQTRSSRDGGVDAIAFDTRPVLGGKIVIQAKRYKNTVGVAAVRDLYGTMINEGANKGILVTTAGYGPDAFEFSRDKPIELMDGHQLLYLLRQHGVEARIVMPV
ncbi:MAG TPA: restriction endonuclease [Thermoanaerobaculia bacterium]|nr:restriction endonuclease [Thermoanaerobaculia bacterium]